MAKNQSNAGNANGALTPLSRQLGIDDFPEVQEALWEARSKWYNVGTRLKLQVSELDCIDAEPGIGLEDKFNRMIKNRLRMLEPCTWRDIYNALKHPTVNVPHLAAEVMKQKVEPLNFSVIFEAKESQVKEITDGELETTRENVARLQESYIDITSRAAEDMSGHVSVRKLRYSVLCLPANLKKEHKVFVRKAKADIKEAESADDIFYVVGEHTDYLNYSLLKHIISLYGSDKLKKEMTEYVKRIEVFRRKTRLEVFSEVCEDKPERDDGKLSRMITKHEMDWATATLDDVEKFRMDICRELSLYDFSLKLVAVARGCVEITWQVPSSLAMYIQKSVKPNSPTMIKHHVTTLTIDGFIAFESTSAMQNEYKVIRLEWQAIHVHYSHMLSEVSADKVIPHMVERRLLSPAQAKKVSELSKQRKFSAILELLRERKVVGRLPTLCAALRSADLPHIAQRLFHKYQSLLKGEVVPPQVDEELMISREETPLPSAPPGSCLITAQLEGSNLTRAQYNTIATLTSSLLGVPTEALVYVGHTSNPLILHWHCQVHVKGEIRPIFSDGLFSEMEQEGLRSITVGTTVHLVVPQREEMKLFEGAWDGADECVSCAVDAGVSVNITKPDGRSPLMIASMNGHAEVVEKLLLHGASVDVHKGGWSSLMFASENGHVEVVEKLLQHGATVDIQEKNGGSPLMVASQNGHLDVVNKLLQQGARIDLQAKDGRSPLLFASQKGHVKVVEKLLQHGARVDLQEQDGVSPLNVASHNGHFEIVNVLLQHGARVDLIEKDGWGPLMAASQNGHVDVVKTLLEHGARVDLQDEDGWSPLMVASQNQHSMVAETLLQNGARVDLQNKTGVTSLMVAVYHGSSEVVDILLRAKADVTISTSQTCDTVLTLACQRNDMSTVSALLTDGASPNVCNKDGQTPLLLAIRKNNMAMTSELVYAGVDVNFMEEGGLSALMLCCEEGNSETADLLLTSHANPDLQHTSTGFTALMLACKGGHIDTVITLMEHGANSHLRNRENMTASDVASVNEYPDICEVLRIMGSSATANTSDAECDDNTQMQESVEEIVSQFHARMDYIPKISFRNRDKGTALEAPREVFRTKIKML